MAIQIKDSYKVGGLVTSGDISFNNNASIMGKYTSSTTPTVLDGYAALSAGQEFKLLHINTSNNIHLGGQIYDYGITTGKTFLSGAAQLVLRTNNGDIQFRPNASSNNDSSVFTVKSDGITATKLLTSHGIGTDTPGSNNVGTASSAFNNMSAKQFTIYPSTNTLYGYIKIQTEGTTSAGGETRFSIGNNVATGTAHNAKGKILIYGTNTGYTAIDPGNNSTSNITVELPSASGKIPIMATDAGGYWGILPPTGNEGTWLRTPKSGLIPFEKNSEISSLGTSSWPWYNVCGKNFILYDKNAQSYGYLKVDTDGTANTQGEARLTLGNNIASGAAKNSCGKIALYGTNTGYTMITPGNNSTSSIILTLPSAGGTLARTADNVASATKLNTARTLTIGATGKTFDGSGNVSWSIQEIMKGQGLNYDTACNTLYFNNAGTTYKGRVSVYNNGTEDFLQLGLCSADERINTLQLYPSKATITKHLYIQEGGIQLNASKTDSYYAFDTHRKCDSGSAGFSTARFGCVNSYGGMACIETRHDGATVGYVRALPDGGVQIGSGRKLYIQKDAPTAYIATGDIWIDI